MNRVTIARAPSPQFILITLACAIALNLLPWAPSWPVPDFLAVVLVFWGVQAPTRLGLWPAFMLGLLMDVHNGYYLGEHALVYSLLTYGGMSLHRRLSGFSAWGQAAHLLAVFLIAAMANSLVRWASEGAEPNPTLGLLVISNTLCWLFANRLILSILTRRPRSQPAKTKPNRPAI